MHEVLSENISSGITANRLHWQGTCQLKGKETVPNNKHVLGHNYDRSSHHLNLTFQRYFLISTSLYPSLEQLYNVINENPNGKFSAALTKNNVNK